MPDKKTILKCHHCSKNFKYDSERRRHEQSHSPQFQCKVCGKNFSFISALRRHEKQHERTGSVQCSECGREFRDHILLKRHTKYAHGGTYTCTKCNAVFSSEPALCTHMKTHKSPSERRYQCSFTGCPKKFNFAHHLKHHELTHTNTKQYYCKICNKGFIQSHHLKTHLKTHTADTSLYCSFADCDKKFATPYAKKRHLAKHHKADSGISSDSNSACDMSCETKKKTDNDAITCSSCGLIILKSQYEKHTFSCIKNFKEEFPDDAPIATFEGSGVEDHIIDPPNENIENDEVSNCKLVLGSCIMVDKGEKCVCAQISKTVNEDYDFTPIENEPINMSKVENNVSNFCEGCDCSERRNVRNEGTTDYYDNRPLIEYKADGTVKLKDIFEMDIPPAKNVKTDISPVKTVKTDIPPVRTVKMDIPPAKTVKVEVDRINNDAKFIPYNSCKAVLGNCIVSGNGMMGDGCLCARMALDEQATAQEIDDITPRPKYEMSM